MKKSIKQFLRPDWRRLILLLIIVFIADKFALFPSYGPHCIGEICTLCCSWHLGTFIEAINSTNLIVYTILIGELFIFYLISCLLVEYLLKRALRSHS